MAKTKKPHEELSHALGGVETLAIFLDEKPRKAYPMTLKEYMEYGDIFTTISTESLPYTCLSGGAESLKELLRITFKDEDVDELLEQVNAKNYKELMREVMTLHGFDLGEESKQAKKA